MPEDKQVSYGWRDLQYQKFYEVVDQVVHELQEHNWVKKHPFKECYTRSP